MLAATFGEVSGPTCAVEGFRLMSQGWDITITSNCKKCDEDRDTESYKGFSFDMGGASFLFQVRSCERVLGQMTLRPIFGSTEAVTHLLPTQVLRLSVACYEYLTQLGRN